MLEIEYSAISHPDRVFIWLVYGEEMTKNIQRTPNIEKDNNDIITYWESYWQSTGQTDSIGSMYPIPTDEEKWNSKLFISKLKILQNKLVKTNRSTAHSIWVCPLCKLDVSDHSYNYRDMNWNASLKHQIKIHNWHPSRIFMDFLLGATVEIRENNNVIVLAGVQQKESGKLFVTRNQWGILDALMNSGGKRQWIDDNNKKRYTESGGYLVRNGSKNEVDITIGKSNESDPADKTILFPNEMPAVVENEYYFHTHPSTSRPGGRLKNGIIYEFPSPGDLLHFIAKQSYGKTRGSIIVCPEGIYIICRDENKKLSVPENAGEQYFKWLENVEDKAIADFKLKNTPSLKQFYEEIAVETKYAKSLDRKLQKWGLRLHYIPRAKIGGKWIIEGGYLP